MLSIFILFAALVVSFIITAWGTPLAARKVGSTRGGFQYGVIAFLLLVAIHIVFIIANVLSRRLAGNETSVYVFNVILLAAELCVIFLMLRRIFVLPNKRTLVPFAVVTAIFVAQVNVAVFILRPFVVEPFVATDVSMLPTIEHDDRLLVNKLLRPRRWDLVVYWNDDPQEKLAFCKRLIGLPGEKLRFEGGNLYVNDEVVQMPPVLAGRNLMHPGTVHRAPGRYNDGTAIVLGPEEYFFVGDNLDMSLDSRQLGPSPSSSIIGVVDVLYWPLGRARIFR